MPTRRLVLGALAVALGSAWIGGGCSATFDSISKVNGLRVFAVVPDRAGEEPDGPRRGGSYANPGDTVHLEMEYFDGFVDPEAPGDGPRNVRVTWLGGCFNPPGDQYFRCYQQLADVLAPFAQGGALSDDLPDEIGQGAGFDLQIPTDIVSSRPVPPTGPHYGIAYVFFTACAGRLGVVDPEGTSEAGSFPLGCFDEFTNQRLGPDSFVPGYTQIYVFADGRTNQNPRVDGLTLDGNPIDPDISPTVERCPITEEDRRVQGCAAEDPKQKCKIYDLEVLVPTDVAEVDPDATGSEGERLTEAVWVDYYADAGDLASSVKLVNDSVTGFNDEAETEWIPPSEPGLVNIWAVVHDARGGSSFVYRTVLVE